MNNESKLFFSQPDWYKKLQPGDVMVYPCCTLLIIKPFEVIAGNGYCAASYTSFVLKHRYPSMVGTIRQCLFWDDDDVTSEWEYCPGKIT